MGHRLIYSISGWVPEGTHPPRRARLVRSVTRRVDHELVNQRADRQSRAGASVGAAPLHIAHLIRRVWSRARTAANVFDGEEVVAHQDSDVAAHVLLVLHRVGPVVLGIERIPDVERVEAVGLTGEGAIWIVRIG